MFTKKFYSDNSSKLNSIKFLACNSETSLVYNGHAYAYRSTGRSLSKRIQN